MVTELLSLALLVVSGLLFVVGFSTPYWVEEAFSRQGLWRLCIVNSCMNFVNPNVTLASWFAAVQFFECLCFIGIMFGIVLILCSLVDRSASRPLAILTFCSLIAAGGSGILGGIIYAAKFSGSHFGYSFYLTLGGAVGVGLTSFVALVGGTRSPDDAPIITEKKGQWS